jgi:hypothetical protein
MSVQSEGELVRVGGAVAATAMDRRLARAVVATLVIGGYVASASRSA